MNTASTPSRILVWDLPTRLFHWLLATSFAGAWLTAESERWIDLHVLLGYTMAVLVAFRIVWGIAGTRHARFRSFAFGPREVLAYLRSLAGFRAPHFTGHNPAGSWAIFGLLALAVVVTATGIATFNDAGGHWLEELHEGAATAMLVLVFVHIAGVLVGSLLHRENLVASMFTGRKWGATEDAIGTPRRVVAALLLAVLAGVWTGVVPLPGMGGETSLTAIKADARAARHTDEGDD
jgi:cytochrome b